jgi:hypothetical protein
MAVVVRHFRYLQRKEARQTAQKAFQKGRRKKPEEAATDQVGQAARRGSHRSPTIVEGNSARGGDE